MTADDALPPVDSGESASPTFFWKVLLLALLLQAGLLLFEQREHIVHWLSKPFLQADYGYHYYFSTKQAESTLMGRGYTGYDPQMFGGMDLWPQVTPSDRVTVFLMTLTPKSWWPAVFNFQYLAMFLLIPPLFIAACWRFGIGKQALLFAVPVGLILFWLTLPSFLSRGIVTFAFSLFVALYLASEVHHLTKSFSHVRAALIAIGVAALVFTHPAAAFVVGFLALTVLVAQRKSVDRRIVIWILAACLLTFAINWPWARVLPWFKYSAASTASALTFPSLAAFWEYHYTVPGISGLRIFLPVLLVVGSLPLVLRDPRYRKLAGITALWAVFFTALYVFGSFIPLLKLMQPQRFNMGVKVMGAIYGVVILAFLIDRTPFGTLASRPVVPVLVALAVVTLCGIKARNAMLGDTYVNHPFTQAAAMIQRHTPDGSRLLVIRGPHEPGIPPDVNEHSIIGSFMNRDLFGTEWILPTLSKFGHDGYGTSFALVEGMADTQHWHEFRDVWEIEYVSFPSKHRDLYLKWLDDGMLVSEAGGFELYKTAAISDRFLHGSGHVTASLNRFSLRNVQPGEGNTILLAYHHSVGHKLVNAPGATIRRKIVPGDKYGFIEVLNPPRNFDIVFDPETAREAKS